MQQIPQLKPLVYDELAPKGKAKEYKEGGAAVKLKLLKVHKIN